MIESCDTDIAGWDEDGLTFTVKDPVKFETQIIPQFFKHSKFSSFVRVRHFGTDLCNGRICVF
jgi:HSF-type DNA-binding